MSFSMNYAKITSQQLIVLYSIIVDGTGEFNSVATVALLLGLKKKSDKRLNPALTLEGFGLKVGHSDWVLSSSLNHDCCGHLGREPNR